jgi:hypothetical protein
MKRNLLAVLLVLPLTFLAIHTAPASGLPTGHVTNRVCGSGAKNVNCTRNCCDTAGNVVASRFALGAGSNCGLAQDACVGCLLACSAGTTPCAHSETCN